MVKNARTRAGNGGRDMKKRLRVTALLLALLLALPGFALAEGGLLESPSLPDDPVVSCEHEFSHTFVEMTDRVEYTPEDADRHKRTDYALYCDVCILCGLTTEGEGRALRRLLFEPRL